MLFRVEPGRGLSQTDATRWICTENSILQAPACNAVQATCCASAAVNFPRPYAWGCIDTSFRCCRRCCCFEILVLLLLLLLLPPLLLLLLLSPPPQLLLHGPGCESHLSHCSRDASTQHALPGCDRVCFSMYVVPQVVVEPQLDGRLWGNLEHVGAVAFEVGTYTACEHCKGWGEGTGLGV
jgi:hypothetical protein